MIQMLMEALQAFFVKIMDNGLGTFKTIYLNKEKYIIGALFASASNFFYLVGVRQVATDSSYITIIVMTIATFIGTLLPGLFIQRTERDKLWIFEITASSMEAGKDFADGLRELDIAVKTEKARDSDLNKVLSCKAYCNTKEESRIVKSAIPEDFHYHVYAPIED